MSPGRRRFVPSGHWGDRRQRRGLAGERVALAFLVSCGYEVEAHRFRLGRHDLDLVVRQDRLVAFVEVKTRRSSACGTPLEGVSALKRHILSRVATLWRLRYGRPGDRYRFDVVGVRDRGHGRWDVDHVPDAWRMDWSPC